MRIEIEDTSIEMNIEYGNRTKIAIHIDSVGLLTVKVPNGTSKEVIVSTVQRHGKQILKKLQGIAEARETPKTREYEDKGKFLYLGKEYFLHELIDTGELSEDELKKNLKKFYYTSCKNIVEKRIHQYQGLLKVKPKSIEVIDSKTKWGSCSSGKKVCFNYRLAMAPLEVIDYVVIHELCHLIHMNHDRSFWRRVGSIMPDYKEKEVYLARHGQFMTL
ncbi:M48 family metallopeptidase [Paenibacillus sp. FJAT-26967]|uniref:M48 family metallopeptidase n=1 Tax=Paenibacillus sp. FJAT-26967 TaxID=1729690 RepID=UPI00083925C1|nr:SprT family zinc-dependent metalloprotease [Paenibacillus sp. FJAT-26967]